MTPSNRELFAHLATALGRYHAELRRDGRYPPEVLSALLVFLADCARMRQDATPLACSADARDGEPMTRNMLLTKREAAAELRVSVRTLERLIASDRLPAVPVEGAVRIRRTDLEAYVSALAPRSSFRDQIEEKSA